MTINYSNKKIIVVIVMLSSIFYINEKTKYYIQNSHFDKAIGKTTILNINCIKKDIGNAR